MADSAVNHLEEINSLKAEIASLKAEKDKAISDKVAGLENQLKVKADELVAAVTKASETEKALAEAKAKLDEVTAKLVAVEAESVKAKRLNAITKALGVDDEKAATLYENLYADLADAKFEKALKIQAEDYEAMKKAAFEKAGKDNDGDKKDLEKEHGEGHPKAGPIVTKDTKGKPDGHTDKHVKTIKLNPKGERKSVPTPPASTVEVKAGESYDPAAANATQAALDNAKVDQDVALATAETADSEVESVKAEVAEFLNSYTGSGRGRRGRQAKNEE